MFYIYLFLYCIQYKFKKLKKSFRSIDYRKIENSSLIAHIIAFKLKTI